MTASTDIAESDAAQLQETLGDLVQASHRLTRLAARVTGNTESPATWRTLSVLQAYGAMRLGELATHSRVSQPTMTKIVNNLVETGWVRRIADADDARAWQIAGTATGECALAGWRDQLASALLPLFTDLPADDVAALQRTVAIIAERVDVTDAATAHGTAGSTREGTA